MTDALSFFALHLQLLDWTRAWFRKKEIKPIEDSEDPAHPKKPGESSRCRTRFHALNRSQPQAGLLGQLLLRQVAGETELSQSSTDRLQKPLIRQVIVNLQYTPIMTFLNNYSILNAI